MIFYGISGVISTDIKPPNDLQNFQVTGDALQSKIESAERQNNETGDIEPAMNFPNAIEEQQGQANANAESALQPMAEAGERANHLSVGSDIGVDDSKKRRNDDECFPSTSNKRLKMEIPLQKPIEAEVVSSDRKSATVSDCSSESSSFTLINETASSCAPNTTDSLASYSSFSPSTTSSTIFPTPPSYTEDLRVLYGTAPPKQPNFEDEDSD